MKGISKKDREMLREVVNVPKAHWDELSKKQQEELVEKAVKIFREVTAK